MNPTTSMKVRVFLIAKPPHFELGPTATYSYQSQLGESVTLVTARQAMRFEVVGLAPLSCGIAFKGLHIQHQMPMIRVLDHSFAAKKIQCRRDSFSACRDHLCNFFLRKIRGNLDLWPRLLAYLCRQFQQDFGKPMSGVIHR